MRGGDNRTGELFSNVDLENRVRLGPSVKSDQRACELVAPETSCALCDWAAVDTAGEAAPSDAVTGISSFVGL